MQSTVTLFPLTNYSFGTKDPATSDPTLEPSAFERLKKLQEDYSSLGMRQTLEALLLVHDHGHPHILMLQTGSNYFKLPGGVLKPGEDDNQGLKRILNGLLGKEEESKLEQDQWEIGELVAVWWRPNFEVMEYPYLPTHITKPKEMKKVYMVHLPERKLLSVPKNLKLLAVPLFELQDNAARYGSQLSALTHLLSRFNFASE